MQMASAPFHDAAWESDSVEEPVWETNKIHAARVRQIAERGRALVEDLRYTLALSQRLVRASRALLKRSKDQGVATEP